MINQTTSKHNLWYHVYSYLSYLRLSN